MTGFNHTLAGMTVALVVQQPILVAPVALLSHFVMDALPHFGRHPSLLPYNIFFKRYLIIDALLCISFLLVGIFLAPTLWLLLAWGAAWATLPDFLWPLKDRAPNWARPFFRFHHVIQWGERPYGWIYEIGYLIGGATLMVSLLMA